MLSRKHYKEIGNIIKESFNGKQNKSSEILEVHNQIVYRLGAYFKHDNPSFDYQRFVAFVNKEE